MTVSATTLKCRAACIMPTPGFSLESVGHKTQHLRIVNKEYVDNGQLSSYLVKAKSAGAADIDRAAQVAALMGKELLMTGAKAIGTTLSIMAAELRYYEREIESPIDNPVLKSFGQTYIIIPDMFCDPDLVESVALEQLRYIGDFLSNHSFKGGDMIISGPVPREPQLRAFGKKFTRDALNKSINSIGQAL